MTTAYQQESAPLSETVQGYVQRLLEIYREYKPLLDGLARWRIVPRRIREAIAILGELLDALAGLEITARFKAGRDL